MPEPVVIEMGEMIAFIQERLIAQGFAVSDEAVALVLDAETEFLDSKGLIEYHDQNEGSEE